MKKFQSWAVTLVDVCYMLVGSQICRRLACLVLLLSGTGLRPVTINSPKKGFHIMVKGDFNISTKISPIVSREYLVSSSKQHLHTETEGGLPVAAQVARPRQPNKV